MRLAFAHFGIVTPVLSVVLSVFMLGLGAGSLIAGRFGPSFARRLRVSPAALYGGAELIIALGAPAVPALFALGESVLLHVGAVSSGGYLALVRDCDHRCDPALVPDDGRKKGGRRGVQLFYSDGARRGGGVSARLS